MTSDLLNSVQPSSPQKEITAAPSPRRFPKRLRRGAIALVLLSLVGAGGYAAYRKVIEPQQVASQSMMTLPVERRDLALTVSANGTVKPERVINVSPKSSGVLRSLLVREGDFVQKGDIIAEMDDSNLRGQLTQASANLASAEANLQQLQAGNRSQDIAQSQARLQSAQASLQQAEDTYQRYAKLAQEGAIAQQNLNQYKTSRDTAQAQVLEMQQALSLMQVGARPEAIAQAQAQVESARGALESIQTQINDTILRAPFSGTVIRKYADPGAFVTPTTASSSVSSATSSSILALASENQVVANIAENNISKIRLGQAVTIKADAFPEQKFTGKVTQIASQATVEQNVTSFEVKVAIADPQNRLRSGMNVSLQFDVGKVKNAVTVPNAAVVRQQNGTGVFVAGANNQPIFTPITTGVTVSNRTEVKSGLKGNEKVLLSLPKMPPAGGGGLPGLPSGNRNQGQSMSVPIPPGGNVGGGR
ncbi:MAG: efflux RND transporter periplasmic adaptor subunit [Oculatellaceae cyanobacterium bins.114]|nr:efflux RND transporter periplasmic adaptor subunit [Oculatellaceae cyanobacterium bins.114]